MIHYKNFSFKEWLPEEHGTSHLSSNTKGEKKEKDGYGMEANKGRLRLLDRYRKNTEYC